MPAFLLSLREGLEAALIVGIVLGTLQRLGHRERTRFVWAGVAAAIAGSVLVAFALNAAGAQFEGRPAQIFEGVTLFLAAGVLTWMIFWMQRQGRNFHQQMVSHVQSAVGEAPGAGRLSLFSLAFLAVFREGVELALFLVATSIATSAAQTLIGALLGLMVAAALGALLAAGTVRINLTGFFRVTSGLLILFAAGMVAYGSHELIEAGIIPALLDPLYNITHLLDDRAGAGLMLKALFGYNGNPALLETLAYIAYFVAIWWALRRQNRPQAAA